MFDIKLYVASSGPDSLRIVSKLQSALERKCKDGFSFEVVNVLENPEIADHDGILATPTTIRFSPKPQIRMIGNFHDIQLVLEKLGLNGEPGEGGSGHGGETDTGRPG